MKLRKLFVIGILTLSATFSFAQNLKVATIAPAKSVWDTEAKKLAQEISKATNGKVKMQFMNATAMGGETGVVQKLNSVRPGQKAPIDGVIFTGIGLTSLVPDLNIMTFCAPYLFRNQEEVDLVYDHFKPRFQEELSKKGYVFLGSFIVGWAYFYTKKPVHTPQDLKSQKLSVAGLGLSALSDAFKAAGFRTEDVPADKLLQSMKSPGGVEGFYTIPMYAYAGQYYKSLKYILNAPICPVLASFIISEATWNSFSDNEKKIILEEVAKAEKRFIQEQQNADKEYLDLCAAGGCEIINLTPEEFKVMESTLYNDATAMAKTGLIDIEFYNEAKEVLRKHRGE